MRREAAKILRQRRLLRAHFFDTSLFGEPCWDMLLALAETDALSVTSLVHASATPPTTALRYIQLLDHAELIGGVEHPTDKRSRLISLSPHGASAMVAFLERTA